MTRPGALILLATVAAVVAAMLVYQDWWTLPFLAFGLLVNALDRRGVPLGPAVGIGLAIACSFLAIGAGVIGLLLDAVSMRAACPPDGCATGPDPLLVSSVALILAGVVGLAGSMWWLVRTWRASDPRRASRGPHV